MSDSSTKPRHKLTPEEQAERDRQVTLLKSLAPARGDFQTIAAPLLKRGFWLVPTIFKTPALRNYPNMSQDLRLKLAKPWHNIAVWSKRGVGNRMFLDIDSNSVRERIEKETGKFMPRTYTVMTRPFSEHMHYYLNQTEVSVKLFDRTINIRDLEVEGRPTLYDVKGVGGASYVVAAGSVRENGDLYTVDDGSPVQDIQEFIAEWLCADLQKFLADKAEAKRQKFKAREVLRLKYTPEERARMRAQNNPDGFLIDKEDTRDYMVSLAFSLALAGLNETIIQETLIAQVKDVCRDGEIYVSDEHNKLSIAKIAHSAASTVTIDASTRFYHPSKLKKSGNLKIDVPARQHNAMVEVMDSLSYPIDGNEACALLMEGVIGLKKLKPAAFRNACKRARDTARVEVKPLGNGRFLWTKKKNQGDTYE